MLAGCPSCHEPIDQYATTCPRCGWSQRHSYREAALCIFCKGRRCSSCGETGYTIMTYNKKKTCPDCAGAGETKEIVYENILFLYSIKNEVISECNECRGRGVRYYA